MEPDSQADRKLKWERFIARMQELAKKIGEEWQSDKGAVELLIESREEEDRAHWVGTEPTEADPAHESD